MGFEQLAELRKQLAKEARAAKEQARATDAEKSPRPAAPRQRDAQGERGAKGHREAKGQHEAKGPRDAKAPRGEARGPRGEARPHQMPKAEPVDPVVRVIGKLQKRFPAAFPKNPAPKVPLKIGVLADLLSHAEELALNEAQIREAVSTWCRGSRYWACLVDGAARVDLEGAPAGSVTARDAAFARRQAKGGGPGGRRKGDGAHPGAKTAEQAAQASGSAVSTASEAVRAGEAVGSVESTEAVQSGETVQSAPAVPSPGAVEAAAAVPSSDAAHAPDAPSPVADTARSPD